MGYTESLHPGENSGTEEKKSLEYLNYPGRPQIIQAHDAIESGAIQFRSDGTTLVTDQTSGVQSQIDRRYQYSLVEATLYGLNEALVKAERGKDLRLLLEAEIEKIEENYENHGDLSHYGVYSYYPNLGMLAQFAPAEFHRLALVASTSSLLEDPEMNMDWPQVRSTLENIVVASAGTSVGNRIAHAITQDIRPWDIKVADPNRFKLTNFNRVQGAFWDVVYSNEQADQQVTVWGLKNKAVGLAEQIHSLDPFMRVWTYYDGVNEQNIKSFVGGNGIEPKPHFLVEETDDPNMKVRIREECRKQGVRVIMASDAGSAVQVDIRAFDVNPDASLAYSVTDEELYARQRDANARPKDRDAFFGFADALLGKEYKRDEFGAIIKGNLPRFFASVPQLGSTAAQAGAVVAEVVSRTALGYKFPERFIVDKRRLELTAWGETV